MQCCFIATTNLFQLKKFKNQLGEERALTTQDDGTVIRNRNRFVSHPEDVNCPLA